MVASFAALLSVFLVAAPPPGQRLDFELKGTREHMKPVPRPPWFEPGGRWTVFDCTVSGVDFIVATGDAHARFGPAREEHRAALVTLLAKTFSVPVAPPVPGSAGLLFNSGSSSREVLGGGGFGPSDAPVPLVFGDDVVGSLAPDTDGQRQFAMLQFAFTPKKKVGWLRTDDPKRLVAEVARGAWKAGPGWMPIGEAGGGFLGFVGNGRAVLSTKAGAATALDLVSLESRKLTALGRFEGDVHQFQCATPLERGCIALVGAQLWSMSPGAPARTVGPPVHASNVRVWASRSGAWVALHTNRICIPHGCADQLLVMNVATGATVVKKPIESRGFLEGLGVTWKLEGRQEVLLVESAEGLERFVAPAFKPASAKPETVSAGQLSPDGRLVVERRQASGGDAGTGTIDVIREVASGVERRVELEGLDLSWLDSRVLLARGKPMRVIDATTGKVRMAFDLPAPPLNFVGVDPGLKWLLAQVEDQLLLAPLPAVP